MKPRVYTPVEATHIRAALTGLRRELEDKRRFRTDDEHELLDALVRASDGRAHDDDVITIAGAMVDRGIA